MQVPTLCLIVTRRCNLRCGYCPIEFQNVDMAWETAKRAVESIGQGPLRVKLFGGEPLLNWDLVRRLVEAGRREWMGMSLRFELPTNGALLDPVRLEYLSSRPEVAVSLSRPMRGGESLPGVGFNFIMARGTGAESAARRLAALVRAGYRRFNFLPTYFVPWADSEISELRRSFRAIAMLLLELRTRGRRIEVWNIENRGPTPLYNSGPTIDSDGTIYASNLAQVRGLGAARMKLRLGSVFDMAAPKPPPQPEAFSELLRGWAGEEAWAATLRADEALSEFVAALRASGRGQDRSV